MKKYLKNFSLSLILVFSSAHMALAYSFNANTGMSTPKFVAVQPALIAAPLSPFTLKGDLIAVYGFGGGFDIIADLSFFTYADSKAKYGGFYAFPRYEIAPNLVFGIRAGYDQSELSLVKTVFVEPQLDYFWENDNVAIEFNVFYTAALADSKSSIIGAVLAPVFKIAKDRFYLYVEIDPSYGLKNAVASDFVLNIVPGIWLGFNDALHQFNICVPLNNVQTKIDAGIGLWYAYSF